MYKQINCREDSGWFSQFICHHQPFNQADGSSAEAPPRDSVLKARLPIVCFIVPLN